MLQMWSVNQWHGCLQGVFENAKSSASILDPQIENPWVKFSKRFIYTLTFENHWAKSDENKLFQSSSTFVVLYLLNPI